MSSQGERNTASRRMQILRALSIHTGHTAMPGALRDEMGETGYHWRRPNNNWPRRDKGYSSRRHARAMRWKSGWRRIKRL